MSNIKQLLDLANPIFKKMEEHIKAKDFEKAYVLLNSPQPTEWIREEKEGANGDAYYFNDIELIEGLMSRVFKTWWREIISNSIVQEKNKYASTCVVRIWYKNFEGQTTFTDGIATVTALSLELLQLAVPLSATNAKSNGIRQLGSLFGLSLNRIDGMEPAPPTRPIIEKDYGNTDDEEKKKYLEFKRLLENAETKQVAETMLAGSEFKLIRELQLIVQNKK